MAVDRVCQILHLIKDMCQSCVDQLLDDKRQVAGVIGQPRVESSRIREIFTLSIVGG